MRKNIFATAAAVAIALPALAGAALAQQAAEPDDDARQPQARGMARVESGTFSMGGRSVALEAFYMDVHQVTQREWRELMGTTARQQRDRVSPSAPMRGEGDNHPMYFVSWFDAVEFANRRSLRAGLAPAYTIAHATSGRRSVLSWNRDANGYRLPTEAEWEFAARGGAACREDFTFSGSDTIGEVGWHNENTPRQDGRRTTQPVGMLRPNALGIYDMTGNVWEWVWDEWDGPPNPRQRRVIRGGSIGTSPERSHTAHRTFNTASRGHNHLGFRLTRSAD